jgi:hypothetical protein
MRTLEGSREYEINKQLKERFKDFLERYLRKVKETINRSMAKKNGSGT